MIEIDELAKRRKQIKETTSSVRDGIMQFLGFNTSGLLERTLATADFQPIHPSEDGEKAYAVRRPFLQQALQEGLPKLSAQMSTNPEGSAHHRTDMDSNSLTVELTRDLRKLSGNKSVVLYVQFTITAFDAKRSGLTRLAYGRRPGSRHDLLLHSGVLEPVGKDNPHQ